MQKSKWAIEEKLLTGTKFPYTSHWECLDMEKQKQNKLLQDTNLKILFY